MVFEKSVLPKPNFSHVLVQSLEPQNSETPRKLSACKKMKVSKLKVASVVVSQVLQW